jgi:hypothetical protein
MARNGEVIVLKSGMSFFIIDKSGSGWVILFSKILGIY